MLEGPQKTRLFYRGTADEVRVGDRVSLRRWLRRSLTGVVVYVPSEEAAKAALARNELDEWAIELEDGSLIGWAYFPEQLQPAKRVQLLARADGPPRTISNPFLEPEPEPTLREELKFAGCLIASGFALTMALWLVYVWATGRL